MISTLFTSIDAQMKELGFLFSNTIADRRYYLQFNGMQTDAERRGGVGSGKIRVRNSISIVVYYKENKNDSRQLLKVVEDQERIAGRLNGLIGILWFSGATVTRNPNEEFIASVLAWIAYDEFSA